MSSEPSLLWRMTESPAPFQRLLGHKSPSLVVALVKLRLRRQPAKGPPLREVRGQQGPLLYLTSPLR